MTTRQAAEALLFDVMVEDVFIDEHVSVPEPVTTSPSPTRRRVQPIYCPRCRGWVEITLQPVRLHCTGCGLEATP